MDTEKSELLVKNRFEYVSVLRGFNTTPTSTQIRKQVFP